MGKLCFQQCAQGDHSCLSTGDITLPGAIWLAGHFSTIAKCLLKNLIVCLDVWWLWGVTVNTETGVFWIVLPIKSWIRSINLTKFPIMQWSFPLKEVHFRVLQSSLLSVVPAWVLVAILGLQLHMNRVGYQAFSAWHVTEYLTLSDQSIWPIASCQLSLWDMLLSVCHEARKTWNGCTLMPSGQFLLLHVESTRASGTSALKDLWQSALEKTFTSPHSLIPSCSICLLTSIT